MKKIFLILILLLACVKKDPETEKTTNKYKKEFEKSVTALISECVYEKSVLSLKLKKQVLFDNNFVDTLQLALNKEFKIIDHHSNQTYSFKNASNNNITLAYYYTFDHSSFGKNKITKDSGFLEIPCTDISHG